MKALLGVRVVVCAVVLTSCATSRVGERQKMARKIDQMAAVAPSLANDPVFRRALAAVAVLPREAFVPRSQRSKVYRNTPLEIGWGQTISDPYIVAVMTAAAKVQAGANVLEVGTGSGYQAAMLAQLGARVATIEIVPQLAARAAQTLRQLGYTSVMSRAGDGFGGWPDRAPFDAIIVTAGADKVPKPLLDQLKPGGRLIMPIGPSWPLEQIEVFTKNRDGSTIKCSLGSAMFVPLTGRGETPEGNGGLYDRTIPLCYGVPVTYGFMPDLQIRTGTLPERKP